MRIERLDVRAERIPLTRPYAIAFAATETADLVFVRVTLVLDGGKRRVEGLGCAAPVPEITGESFADSLEACERAARGVAALAEAASSTSGRATRAGWDPGLPSEWLSWLESVTPRAPGARAAIDMALHDACARAVGLPLVEWFGRANGGFATSITIGIRPLDETLAEAREYRARGFDTIKVKVGVDLDEDVERLARLREELGPHVVLRADANMGYDVRGLERFFALTRDLRLELVEQPVPPALDDELRRLPAELRRVLAADESLHGPGDVAALVREPKPYGIWNVKLAKCGGLAPARAIARAAAAHGVELMWGCMDESVVSIAAALHVACAASATRYLDLDGSFDLARDPAVGGFALERGRMSTLSETGLGARMESWT